MREELGRACWPRLAGALGHSRDGVAAVGPLRATPRAPSARNHEAALGAARQLRRGAVADRGPQVGVYARAHDDDIQRIARSS